MLTSIALGFSLFSFRHKAGAAYPGRKNVGSFSFSMAVTREIRLSTKKKKRKLLNNCVFGTLFELEEYYTSTVDNQVNLFLGNQSYFIFTEESQKPSTIRACTGFHVFRL